MGESSLKEKTGDLCSSLNEEQDWWLLTAIRSRLTCVPGTCDRQTLLTLLAKNALLAGTLHFALRQRDAF